MNKKDALDNLKNRIIKDKVTPELASTATSLVFGSGSIDAEIVFVGEAPGKKEDEMGEPFVGASGKLLNEMLAENNIDREDVYITNIVKYRPPNNRDPKPEEKDAFWPYLLEQVAIIRPKVIATLGRHSGLAFNQSLRISADHGKPQGGIIKFSQDDNSYRVELMHGDDEQRTEPYDSTAKGVAQLTTKQKPTKNSSTSNSVDGQAVLTVTIVPLYHPAAAIYNRSLRDTLLEDFAIVKKLIK
jgi:DNA polymerase